MNQVRPALPSRRRLSISRHRHSESRSMIRIRKDRYLATVPFNNLTRDIKANSKAGASRIHSTGIGDKANHGVKNSLNPIGRND